MARKKEEISQDTGNLISDLIQDTDFRFITNTSDGGSLTDKPRVETPLYVLNDLLGGGLPLGSIVEIFGPSASGKSSFMYETLGNFQRQYPNGVSFIIDSEASTDDSRIRQLGVDPSKCPIMGAGTLESGFEQIIKILKKMVSNSAYKGFPVMIVWDTIAGCSTEAQTKDGGMFSGGIAERARIIKTSLTNIFPLVEKQNVLLVLLNQISAEIGGYRPGVTSSGGNALRHDVHIRCEFKGGKTEFDGVFATEKRSTISITKSKISPIISNIPMTIDIPSGGIIDKSASLLEWMETVNPSLFKQSAWWKLEEWVYDKYKDYWDKIEGFDGTFRQSYLDDTVRTNNNLRLLLRLIWVDMISERYTLQSEVCKGIREQIKTELDTNLGVVNND